MTMCLDHDNKNSDYSHMVARVNNREENVELISISHKNDHVEPYDFSIRLFKVIDYQSAYASD